MRLNTITHASPAIPQIHETRTPLQPRLPHPCPRLEASLVWLSQGTQSLVEFAKDSRHLALRAATLGIPKVTLCSPSHDVLNTGKKLANNAQLQEKLIFSQSEISALSTWAHHSFSAVMAHGVLDEIYPEEAQQLIEALHRICVPSGKALFTLGRSQRRQSLLNQGASEIDDSFFELPNGHLTWDISTEAFLSLCKPFFEPFSHFEVPEGKQFNGRIFLFTAKSTR